MWTDQQDQSLCSSGYRAHSCKCWWGVWCGDGSPSVLWHTGIAAHSLPGPEPVSKAAQVAVDCFSDTCQHTDKATCLNKHHHKSQLKERLWKILMWIGPVPCRDLWLNAHDNWLILSIYFPRSTLVVVSSTRALPYISDITFPPEHWSQIGPVHNNT